MATKAQQPESQEAAQPIDNADAALLVGGPGQENPEPEEAAQPQFKEVIIKGRKFAVDPDLAKTLEDREKEWDGFQSRQGRELGELRQKMQQLESRQIEPAKPVVVEDDDENLMFAQPKQWMSKFEQKIESKLEAKYRQERERENQQRNQEEITRKFWDKFYRINQDLDPEEDGPLVQGVLHRNMSALYHLSTDEGVERLGDLARRQMLKYSQRAKDEQTETVTPRTRVESASRPVVRRAPSENEGPNTLSDFIKARQARRRAAGKSA